MSLPGQLVGQNFARLDHNIIHVCFDIPTDLIKKALLDHTHDSGASILQTKRHGDIAETPERGDEGHLYFIWAKQTDLLVTRVCI